MSGRFSLRQIFLRTLIAGLAVSALIGIFSFLFGDFGPYEVKLLLTTLSISFFSITSLACGAALEARRSVVLALLGFGVSIIGFLVFLPGIWAEWHEQDMYWKFMWTLAIFAFSFAQACLLTLVPLASSVRWLLLTAIGLIFALAAHLSGWIIFEFDSMEEWMFRIAGVLGILDGCGTIMVPAVYKLGNKGAGTSSDVRPDRIELFCPQCGHRSRYAVGAIRCAKCSLQMHVEIPNKRRDHSADD